MRGFLFGVARLAACALLVITVPAAALAAAGGAGAAGEGLLFRQVRVFDGVATTLSPPSDVLVRGNRIARVSRTPLEAPDGVRVVEGGGRTLMPGLIDAHWHSMLVAPDLMLAMTADIGFLNLLAADVAKATLAQGVTTVRDVGGPSFGLKRAIDVGLVPGPRIYPSGAMLSQTGGHGDFRLPHEVPRTGGSSLSRAELLGVAVIADGPDAVRVRTREQLMLGATQVKLMAGGGVSSFYDPLDVSQYTVEEMRAAVEAAENWGTYVTVHAYTSKAVRTALEAGVKCIEHGQLVDEATVRLMAQKGAWWSLQPFLLDEDANPKNDEAGRLKQQMVSQGTERAFQLARKHGVKVAFGTDTLFNRRGVTRIGAQLAKLARWYSPGEVLRIATGWNGELLALSGERNPYPGPIGVVAEGAMADLILVAGDPLADIGLIADPQRHFAMIVKDGKVVKDAP